MKPVDFDLTQASRVYAVANTPFFLLRKLQGDPSARAICDACPGREIVEELSSIVATEPLDAVEAVRPYVYLVSLWFKPEIDHLREAAKLESSIHIWYSYLAEVLLETYSPVQQQVIEVPGALAAPTVSQATDSPTTTRIINAP